MTKAWSFRVWSVKIKVSREVLLCNERSDLKHRQLGCNLVIGVHLWELNARGYSEGKPLELRHSPSEDPSLCR
jgi:hypothetical protein